MFPVLWASISDGFEALLTCVDDTVAKSSPFTHEARRLSDGRVEGVAAARHRDDAVDAI